jgi:hypothetical protein
MVWEVNFWAWLEVNTCWSPTWVSGNHTDKILDLWSNISSLRVADNSSFRVYDYMNIQYYVPSSASYIFYNNKHILNTRYVNYVYETCGKYLLIYDNDNIIRSKNVLSTLDDDFMPMSYLEMREETIGLKSKSSMFYGLEDIRLYECNGQLRFIATNINYSPNEWNLMITGIYDIDKLNYGHSRILYPPYKTSCEKNWIPLIKKRENKLDEEFFIYKWSPFEVGKINNETNKLELCLTYSILSPYFQHVRGSTIFIDTIDGLLGIVHFSENKVPRHYYHMFVLLEKNTFKPLRCSETFYFQEIGIEFCIGFTIKKDYYYFWVSQMDRDPKLLISPIHKYPLKFNIRFCEN